MKNAALCLLLSLPFSLLFSLPLSAQPDGGARAYIQPDGELYAGQLFSLYIEARTETYFLTPPSFPHVALEDAIAIAPQQRGTSFSQRVGGTLYAGIRQRFFISAHKTGMIEIPAYTLTFLAASLDSSREPVSISVITEPLSIRISMPPGVDSIEGLAVTPELRLEERFDTPLEELKVGDAITRSVILEARSALGFLLPETQFEELEGMAVYGSQPRFEDDSARGRTLARRIDSATYLLQREGSFELPAITVDWFDLDSNRLRTLSLQSHAIEVAANPFLDSVVVASFDEDENSQLTEYFVATINWLILYWLQIVILLGMTYLTITMWRKYAGRIYLHALAAIQKMRASQRWLFTSLLLSCMFHPAARARHSLLSWMLRDNNKRFDKTDAYRQIRAGYREGGQKNLGRLQLLRALVAFRFRSGSEKNWQSTTDLNP